METNRVGTAHVHVTAPFTCNFEADVRAGVGLDRAPAAVTRVENSRL
jgi:hypothetical protein